MHVCTGFHCTEELGRCGERARRQGEDPQQSTQGKPNRMTAEDVATATASRPATSRRLWNRRHVALAICGTACYVFLKYMVYLYLLPSLSVHLAGYDGIGPDPAGAGSQPGDAVLSPSFNLTLHPRNTCVDRADVTVLYLGVEPRDCAGKRWEKAVEKAARGDGVGLSERLRDRMLSEWRRNGTVELDVDVKVFGGKRGGVDSGSDIPTQAILCRVIAGGHERGAFPVFVVGTETRR